MKERLRINFIALLAAASLAALSPAAVRAQAAAQSAVAQAVAAQSAAAQTNAPRPAIALEAPESVQPGDPFLCWMASERPVVAAQAAIFAASGEKLAAAESFYMPAEGPGCLYGFLLPLPLKAAPGAAVLAVTALRDDGAGGQDRVELKADFAVQPKSFSREDIPLDKALSALKEKPDPAQVAESLSFAKIFESRDITALFSFGTMAKPLSVAWRETAGFADERRYLYSDGKSEESYHGGVDLGAKSGSDVSACAPGRVVFAGRRILTGNSVVLEHLPGLFSIYFHLSAIAVAEGDIVEQGELIGRVGSTGLSTGPHLHWELRIGDVSVDPHYWLSRPLLDKSGVFSKIKVPMEGR